MNDQQLRELVREIVVRRLAERGRISEAPAREAPQPSVHVGPSGVRVHPSRDVYLTVVNTGDTCIIEPGVSCSHCNYCKSHGY